MSTSTLTTVDCPAPLPVMVVHSTGDTLFPVPDFGLEPSEWWANCAT